MYCKYNICYLVHLIAFLHAFKHFQIGINKILTTHDCAMIKAPLFGSDKLGDQFFTLITLYLVVNQENKTH